LPENQRAAMSDHARIIEALERHDAVAARDAMRAHLTHVETIMMAEDTA
jgi:DNA-binding FadR family transcriptional regulator